MDGVYTEIVFDKLTIIIINIYFFKQSIDGLGEDEDNAAGETYTAENQFIGTRHLGMINSKRHLDQSHMYRAQKGNLAFVDFKY